MRSLHRREFLGLLGGATVAAAGAARAQGAATDIGVSCCAYSLRDLLTAKPPEMDLFDFIDYAAELKLDGVELTSYYFPTEFDDEYLEKLKAKCAEKNLKISGGAVGNVFTHPSGEERAKQIEHVTTWLGHYGKLGAPIMRVFGGNAPQGSTKEEATQSVIECLKWCAVAARRANVVMALENHGGVTADADGVLKIVKGVSSRWLGVTLDTGNFRTADPYEDMARVAPYAVNCHGKVSVTPAGGQPAPVDYARVAKILRAEKYDRYISLEYEGSDPPIEGVRAAVERIRAGLAE